MTRFRYRALDSSGARIGGVIDASSPDAAFESLEANGFSPIDIRPDRPRLRGLLEARRNKPQRKHMTAYIRQLATLLVSGVPLLAAFDTLSRSAEQGVLATRSADIRQRLRAGERLSAALTAALPELPAYVARFAELGELTGQTPAALKDAADRMHDEQKTREELRSALTYPSFLAVAGLFIVLLMMLFVVPRFADFIGDGADVPAITRGVIATAVFMRENMALLVPGAGVAIGGLILAFRHDQFRERWMRLSQSLPVLGKVLHQRDIAAWARTTGLALRHGAGMLDALALGEQSVRSPALKDRLRSARKAVRAGRSLDDALSSVGRIEDPMLIDLLRTGRNAGTIPEMLLFLATRYEEDLKEQMRRLTALAEPATILLIAGFVAFIVISIVLAMTSVYEVGL